MSMNELPALSVLQILILDTLGVGEVQSADLRDRLRDSGFRKSAPAFYQAMSRLEDSGFVSSRYTKGLIDGHTIREKHFKITSEGANALRDAQQFFVRRSWKGAEVV